MTRASAAARLTSTLYTALLVALVFSLLGCADTARFELTLQLPASEPSHRFVLFEARTIDPDNRPDYAEIWDRQHAAEGAELVASPGTAVVAIQGDSEKIAQALSVKVRFCSSADCVGDTGPLRREVWLQFERPLYPGQVTFYEYTITSIPSELDLSDATQNFGVTIVPICDVGCGNGSPTDDYCIMRGDRLVHACDPDETTVN